MRLPHLPFGFVLAFCTCAAVVGVGCGSDDASNSQPSNSGGTSAPAEGTGGASSGGAAPSGTGGTLQTGGSSGGGAAGTVGTTAGGAGGKNIGGGGPSTGGAPGTGGAGGTAGTATGEPANVKGITELHNQARRKVGVPDLSWDPALAAIAQAWASKCVDKEAPTGLIDHNANRGVGYPASVGENIFGSSGTPTAEQAVSSWVGEAKDYNYSANTCSAVCGHYTQVVWKTTQKVGCAIYQCAGLKFGGSLVCDYSPAGNVNGQRPY